MKIKMLGVVFAATCAWTVLAAAGQPETSVVKSSSRASTQAPVRSVELSGKDYNVVLRSEVPAASLRPVPKSTSPARIIRVSRNRSSQFISSVSSSGDVACAVGVEVYRNTSENAEAFLPFSAVAIGGDTLIADDIQTASGGPCPMNCISIRVHGGGDGTGPGFSITQAAIFDGCPGSGGTMILDLLGGVSIDFPDDGGPYSIVIDYSEAEQVIPSNFWLGLASDSPTAGWIVEDEAEIGFTQDIIHTPLFPCDTIIPGSSRYTGMDADIYCSTSAEMIFTGYQSASSSSFFYGPKSGSCDTPLVDCGDGIDVGFACETAADDIQLLVPDCELYGYQVVLWGTDGPFRAEFELWTNDPGADGDEGTLDDVPGQPIPGTAGCNEGLGEEIAETAYFFFDGGVTLPQRVWLVWTDDDENAGPMEAGALAEIGESRDEFAIYDSGSGWVPGYYFEGCTDGDNDACGSFVASIFCRGAEPTGACCETASGTCIDGLTAEVCEGRWLLDATCDSNPFDPPCGVSACCKADPAGVPDGSALCEDLPQTQCEAEGGTVLPGEFCDTANCGINVCIDATGDCNEANSTIGCENLACCTSVCLADPFCCMAGFDWDQACVNKVETYCGVTPPTNDSCFDARPVMLVKEPSTEAEYHYDSDFDTSGASTDGTTLPADPCDQGSTLEIYNDIWFKFNAPGTGDLTIDLCTDPGEGYDSRMAVYEGCDCPGEIVAACDDDGCGAIGGPPKVTFRATEGTCYLIRIGGFRVDGFGPGHLSISGELLPAPDNDSCSNAIDVTLGATPSDTSTAGTDGAVIPEGLCNENEEVGDVNIHNDVWYRFTAPGSGDLTVDLCTDPAPEDEYNPRLAVYAGCDCPAQGQNIVACDDDGIDGGGCGNDHLPTVTFPIMNGECYLIRVGGFAKADFGLGVMTLSGNLLADCPEGPVTFVDPPKDVVDARQPFSPSSTVPRMGIDTITLTGPAGAPADCFKLCETAIENESPNDVAAVNENPEEPGTYTITLLRPITTGAVTSITYTGTGDTTYFTSHPANVNGDSASGPLDILSVIDCLNGVNTGISCPWGLYSCDLDASTECNAQDILRVIDLLNGAGAFDPWHNTIRPARDACLPIP